DISDPPSYHHGTNLLMDLISLFSKGAQIRVWMLQRFIGCLSDIKYATKWKIPLVSFLQFSSRSKFVGSRPWNAILDAAYSWKFIRYQQNIHFLSGCHQLLQ